MKKRYFLLAFIMAIAMLFPLAGCGDANSLRVINFRPEDQEFYDFLVSEFQKETGEKVVYECISTDGYPNLLSSRLTSNNVDVFGTEAANVRSLELRQYMLELDDLKYGNYFSLWDYIEESDASQSMHNGSFYVAPLGSVTLLVYYNKDILSEVKTKLNYANGEYPTTWQEFYSTLLSLQTLKNSSDESKKIDDVITFGGMESWPVSMIVSAAEISTVRAEDDDFYLKLVKGEYDFGHQYYRNFFTRLKETCSFIDKKSTGQTYSLAPSKFALKKCALMIDGSWSYQQIIKTNPDINLGFFPLPLNDDPDKNIYVASKSGSAFAINKGSDKQELAKKFIEFHYKEDIYQKYINFVKTKPSIKNVIINDENDIANKMYAFPVKLTMENMWMDGIVGVDYFRQFALNYISSNYSVQESIDAMNNMLHSTESNWKRKSVIGLWFERFYPDEEFEYLPE